MLQSMGSQRVRHGLVTEQHTHNWNTRTNKVNELEEILEIVMAESFPNLMTD